MSWTKRQFVEQAFAEIGLAAYIFDLQPEQLQTALYRLDAMMAQWDQRTIRLGYPLVASPTDSNLADETNVPDSAAEAIYLNLAVRIAPMMGKQVMIETKVAAKQAYDSLLRKAAMPAEMQFPNTLPVGAGNKSYTTDQVFINTPVDPLETGSGDQLEFN